MSAPGVAHQAILDRILKILALAEGTSFEGEAATARRMAEELIQKYNINISPEAKISRDQIIVKKYVPWGKTWLWERMIAIAVGDLCGCQVYSNGRPDKGGEFTNFKFVGKGFNIEACMYILGEVHRQRQRAWVNYKAKGGADPFGKFCFRFARGLEQKIQKKTTTAQVGEKHLAKLWFEERYPIGSSWGTHGRASSEAGREAGGGTSFSRGAMGTPQRRLR